MGKKPCARAMASTVAESSPPDRSTIALGLVGSTRWVYGGVPRAVKPLSRRSRPLAGSTPQTLLYTPDLAL